MRRKGIVRAAAAATFVVAALLPGGRADALSAKAVLVASGLNRPTAIAAPGDGSGRLFIVERPGRVKIYKSGSIVGTYIDIRGKVDCCYFEKGMHGLAFHPKFETNGKFYVTYTDNDTGHGDLRLSQFTDPTPAGSSAPESSENVRLQINHRAAANHWGGALAFGKKYLYMSTGDGGSGQSANAQSKSSLLGKVLRLNMDCNVSGKEYCIPSSNPYYGSTPGKGEIYHRGLRNPWKMSFDRSTWALWIADVGESRREEIDRVKSPKNLGWNCREGTLSYTGCSGSFTSPVYQYSHSNGRCAIIGGFVVRGSSKASALNGTYVFADYCTGEVWAVRKRSDGSRYRDLLFDHSRNITAFGQSDWGNIYFVSVDGPSDTNGRLYLIRT